MSLHLDYRPQNLDEIIGNQETILKLEKQLLNPDGPHVFLLSGTRGCGKTTLARIATEMIGCDERDIMEIDVANNRGKEDASKLKEGIRFFPMFGKTKAYILDEVHQGTPAYFNALLKTLEDTPKHVYFFLCTTDPQKVLTTVKSRCSQYTVDPLTQKETVQLLEWVLENEEKELDKAELKKISEVCEGIPREALIIN
jgi:DNA polymerase-3 subunit gamma/tau